MSAEPDRRMILASHSAVPMDRIRYYADANASVIRGIRNGVLFVMAWWSGPSVKALRELTQVLAKLDPDGRLEFAVVDTDGCPELHELPEFSGKTGGWGETAWIKDGTVLRTSGLGYHPECFEPNTRALLGECTA